MKNFQDVAATTLLAVIASVTALFGQGLFQSGSERRPTVQDILDSKQTKPKVQTYYLLASAAARKGEINEAMTTLNRGLALDPNDRHLLNLRAALYARIGRTNDAREEFSRVLSLYPGDNYARESLAVLNRTLRPRVQPNTPVAPPAQPDAPVMQTTSAAPATSTSEPEKILHAEFFDQMAEKQRCFQTMTSLKHGHAALVKDDSSMAETLDLEKLVAGRYLPVTPLCPAAGTFSWSGNGPVCSKHGGYDALESEVKTVFTEFNKGMIAKTGRNFNEALRAFDQVLILFPRWGEAHFQMADTLYRMGESKSAIARARECLKITPSNIDAKMLLSNLFFKTGQNEAALKLLDDVAASSEGNIYTLSARSLASAIRAGKSYYQIFPPQ